MPKKVAPSRTRTKTASKVKVVNNRSKSTGSSWLRSKSAALVMALAFMLVGAGTLTWVRAATTTSTLWATSTIPKIISDSDTQAVELGTKFRAQYSGQVLGMRFYKGPQNTGTHTGNLWTSDGRKLASVVFTNETASGWQTANFAVPVDIAANTTYIVSYHAPKGRYSANNNYFSSAYTNGPLTAPRNAGVYVYSAKSAFPRQTYQASNYWVDVVYSTSRFSPTPKPVAPTNLSANVSGTTVTLSWAASTSVGIAKYEVLRGGSVIGSVTTGTAYADSGLTPNTSYSYEVRAVDAAGVASDLSNKVTITVPPAPTPTPEPTPTPTPTPEPSPTPTPTPVGTCPTSTPHVPGGPDGNGGCWPGPGNTGVPAGTTLSNYTGSCTISSGTVVIENKTITCDQFRVKNASTVVVVRKSKFVGSSIWNEDGDGSVPGTLTLEDVTASGLNDSNLSALIAINNVTVIRSDISGGQHNIQCVNNCVVRDTYLHGQVVSGTTHNNTFISNGGHDMLLKHNTLKCEVQNVPPDGGCSSDLSIFGDFDPIDRVTADNNLFVANPSGPTFCAYGGTKPSARYPNPSNVVYINNIFQRGSNGKCAAQGPINAFDPSRPGNRWENNRWEDGPLIPSRN